MSQVLKGVATVSGLPGAVTFSGVGATIKPISAETSHEFELDELVDGQGATKAALADEPTQTMRLELYITGADIATAKTMATPAPLAAVTLSSSNFSGYDGDWNYSGGFNVSEGKGFARVTLNLKRWNGAALTSPS